MAQPQLVHETAADAPRSAYTMLPRATTVAIVASLVGLAGLGWAYTVAEAESMPNMVMGLGEVGAKMPMTTATVAFLAMWAAMMVAMMAPTVAPMALSYRASLPEERRAAAPTAAFVAGRLSLRLGGDRRRRPRTVPVDPRDSGHGRRLPMAAGAGRRNAGWRRGASVHSLEGPLPPEVPPTHRRGERLRLRRRTDHVCGSEGLAHGWHCLGCCWALMVVLLVVGIMNLLWMAAIAAVFLIDKHWAHAEGLTRAVGASPIVLGLAVIVFPELLAYLSGVETDGPLEMGNM